jgi:2-amino-4-hydroxy-6-hydroxymethyldihydropteridine diphosphokinase/dihydropteroate synthase
MTKNAMKELRVSVIFETKALLPAGAPNSWDLPYLNLVVSGKSLLSPHDLLKRLKEIERELGRDLEAPKWAPRIIDLDILAWDDKIIADDVLQVPHPQLINRPFNLSLMASLQPNWRYPVPNHPYSHLTLDEILHSTGIHSEIHKCFMPFPQMVGIVNITPDSFSDGGKYLEAQKAMIRIQELANDGAAVIDLGAQSTRPGAIPISPDEEWHRLEPVLDLLNSAFQNRPANPKISLDSFHPEVIIKALQRYPIDWINDVQGGKDEGLLQIVADTKCKIVLTHSLTVPPSKMAVIPFDRNPISQLCEWAKGKIDQLQALGISQDRIILDPGIGFGKSPFQSLELLREIDMLQNIGCEILVGHSRKSFLQIMGKTVERDLETIGISHYLVKKRVDYLRVHNVEAHQRSLVAEALVEWLQGAP